MIRNLVLLLSSAVLALTGVLFVATPSEAVVFDFVEGYGGRIAYQACEDFSYQWAAASDSSSATSWEATATLYRPNGGTSDTSESYGNGVAAGDSGTFTVCWGEGAGKYRMVVELTFYDDDYEVVDQGSGYGSMQITRQPPPRPARTRSFLQVSDATPHYREVVTFTVRSQIRQHGRWRANSYARVILAGRCLAPRGDSGWVTLVDGNVYRNGIGVKRYRYDIPPSWRCRYASVTVSTSNTKGSVSRRVHVRTSRSAMARVDRSGATGIEVADRLTFGGNGERRTSRLSSIARSSVSPTARTVRWDARP